MKADYMFTKLEEAHYGTVNRLKVELIGKGLSDKDVEQEEYDMKLKPAEIKKKKVLNFNNVTFDEWTNTYVSDILQKIEPIKENRWKDSQRHNNSMKECTCGLEKLGRLETKVSGYKFEVKKFEGDTLFDIIKTEKSYHYLEARTYLLKKISFMTSIDKF
ncbi:hypothetical protein RhiirC2_767429 [Rhizophagus irregularis]|uniref:Uncharacterized protein n=1 Tax=Rhizophagus irregularis TaxID=588596 RepID=A0A2N1P4D4_9GLOM|nr:hypothetical protein RhiirC2_767429 [Rhizophagus irregularis]